jgi:hypothetical protein
MPTAALPMIARFRKARRRGLLRKFRDCCGRQQGLPLTLKFLDEIHLEVGAAGNFENLEQGDQCRVVFELAVALSKNRRFFE